VYERALKFHSTSTYPKEAVMSAVASARPARTSGLRRRISPLALFEALATPHGVDRYLELVNPMLTVRDLRAEVTQVHRSTADTVTLTLRPTRQWKGFQAGQFVQVTVEIEGVRRTRCYSPACSQYRNDGRIELTIKAHPEGLVSQFLHANAAPGLVVGLSQADGTFRLPTQRPDKVLLISGGSGITPVLSMLRTLCDEGYAGDVTFLHYGYTAEGVSYRAELQALADAHDSVRLVLAYTDQKRSGGTPANEDGGPPAEEDGGPPAEEDGGPPAEEGVAGGGVAGGGVAGGGVAGGGVAGGGGDLHGFFGKKHLDAAAPWHADAETFLCGPPGLMKAVRAHYEASGLTDRLHTEEFQPAPAVADDGEVTGTLSFGRSGLSADNTGETLLVQAEAAGLNPEHGCRMGICFSCTQVKTSGCTRNILTGETNSDPDVEVQLCISHAIGDVAIDV
jgi:ferredoxin-NADP reductase